MILLEELVGKLIEIYTRNMVEKRTSCKLFNQEPIEKVLANLILEQINNVLVNLVKGVYFPNKSLP